ncbi:hypothetical protein BH09PAT4_BH09PAT4_06630 [soil metagenome]
MVNIDMSSMSNEIRERFLELREREAMGQLDAFGAEELDQMRRVFAVVPHK